MKKLLYGLGVNDLKLSGKRSPLYIKTYDVWRQILFRCTEECKEKSPTYIGCTISENFKRFSFFYKWCHEQAGFNFKDENNRSYQIDKDILTKGNKLYSEDTCVFVPARINSLFTKRGAGRGSYPLGVSYHKRVKKFQSRCSVRHPFEQHIGYFDTAEEAFIAYKAFKEGLIKSVAEEYKTQVDHRVYAALMKYEVNEND